MTASVTTSSSSAPPDRSADFHQFRQEYAEFGYEGWKSQPEGDTLKVTFQFSLNGEIAFRPTLKLPVDAELRESQAALLDNVLFHIGLMELISYWKAYCSPTLAIRCGSLNAAQESFLSGLIFNGLGEFRYLNGLQMEQEDFVPRIVGEGPSRQLATSPESREECLVPLGGGKDSAVVLSLLKARQWKLWPMFLNPDPAAERVADRLEIPQDTWVSIRRTICPELIRRNQEGALNGHTPFSALLAFIASGYAALRGVRYVVLANESSANEATVPGTMINHQYSKSWHFEEQFARYFREQVHAGTDYFSLLRPWNEAQIACEFARRPELLDVFRSCNVGSKQDRWCAKCPKCLFVYVMLVPYVPTEQLTKVFGADLLNDPELYPTLVSLAGFDAAKPFECVGSMEEVIASLLKVQQQGSEAALVRRFFAEFGEKLVGSRSIASLLAEFNEEHGLPAAFQKVLPSFPSA